MTDHKKEALGLIAGWNEYPPQSRIKYALMEAQIHATLYLAEQVRVSNLIAVSSKSYVGQVISSNTAAAEVIKEALNV